MRRRSAAERDVRHGRAGFELPGAEWACEGIEDLPDELDYPAWTTAAGLRMYSARLKTDRETQRKSPGLIGMVLRYRAEIEQERDINNGRSKIRHSGRDRCSAPKSR